MLALLLFGGSSTVKRGMIFYCGHQIFRIKIIIQQQARGVLRVLGSGY